jgi:hypothetical protein
MIVNPLVFVYRQIFNMQTKFLNYTKVVAALSFLTLIDVIIRVKRSLPILKQDLPILERALTFLNKIKTCIIDVVILVVRLRVFFVKDILLDFSVHLICFLYVIKWAVLPSPHKYFLKKFTRLNSH